jgi:hypothetical protein
MDMQGVRWSGQRSSQRTRNGLETIMLIMGQASRRSGAAGALVLATAALALLSGCTTGQEHRPADSPDTADAEAEAARAEALPPGCDALEETLLRFAPTRAALASRMGPADSVELVTQPNRHVAGVTDSLFTIHYPGLVAGVHKPGGGSDLVSHVAVTDNRYLAFPRIGIGAQRDSVISALGPPAEGQADGSVLTYNCGMGPDQPVMFHIQDGRVSRITIEYYVD